MRDFSNMQLIHRWYSSGHHHEMQSEKHDTVGAESPTPPRGKAIPLVCSVCKKEFVFTLMTAKTRAAAQRRLRITWAKRLAIVLAALIVGVVLENLPHVMHVIGIVIQVSSTWATVICFMGLLLHRPRRYMLIGADGASQPKKSDNPHHLVQLS